MGFKPTRGWISTRGIIAASERLDSIGVLSRNAGDAGIIVAELVKHDPDKTEEESLTILEKLDFEHLKEDCRGLRVGIPWTLHGNSTLDVPRKAAFLRVLQALSSSGADLNFDITIPGIAVYDALSTAEKNIILDTEMKVAMNNYFSNLVTNPNHINSIGDLIVFTKHHESEEYPIRNVAVLERAQKINPTDKLYLETREKDTYFTGEGGIYAALTRHNCNVMLVPLLSGKMQTLAAKAGSPTMSVPMGWYPEGTEVHKDERSGLVESRLECRKLQF